MEGNVYILIHLQKNLQLTSFLTVKDQVLLQDQQQGKDVCPPHSNTSLEVLNKGTPLREDIKLM